MNSNTFDGPRRLLSHARDEIQDAARLIDQFVTQQKGTKKIYQDYFAREEVHRIKLHGPDLPPKVANHVKDAAGNLRDALDHAVYSAAVILNGGKPIKTGFPFALDSLGVAGELASKRLEDNPKEIRPYLMSVNPHKGGNELLWSLNQIRNPNTHRFIVPVGSALMSQSIGIGSAAITTMRAGYSLWLADEREIEFLRLGWGSRIDYRVEISVVVKFEEIEAVAGKPVIETLSSMADEVASVVNGIESETDRAHSSRNH